MPTVQREALEDVLAMEYNEGPPDDYMGNADYQPPPERDDNASR